MASEMEFSQHNKVKRRSPWHGPMVLVLLFFVVILVMSLAFRVSKIEVINASEYTDEEIINASGVERGANLFFVDRFKAASMIFSDLPYMDTVSITRQLPNKIVIQAEGSAPAAYMVIDEEYWLLDRSGKMLGTTDSLTAGEYPEIRSLEPMTVLEGEICLWKEPMPNALPCCRRSSRRSARGRFLARGMDRSPRSSKPLAALRRPSHGLSRRGGRDALPHRHAQKRRFPARRGGRRNALLYERQRLDFQPGLSKTAVFFSNLLQKPAAGQHNAVDLRLKTL